MNTAIRDLGSLEMQQAVERLRNELYRLYLETFGKEPKPEVLLAEAEDLVAKHGPGFELKHLFENFLS